jgi:hypothetical protein
MTNPKPREWWNVFYYEDDVFDNEAEALSFAKMTNTPLDEIQHFVEYADYRALEQRLAEREAEVERLKTAQPFSARVAVPVLERKIKELEAEVERLNIYFGKELDSISVNLRIEERVTQVLEAALKFYDETHRLNYTIDFNQLPKVAFEALAEAAKIREESK